MEPATQHSTKRHILVVANQTAGGVELERELLRRAGDGHAEVLVVAPALNSRLRHWTSDEDDARGAAEDRLLRLLERLERAGVPANGIVGDANPLQAIVDTLWSFPADEIVIATHPTERSNWLSRNVVEQARARTALPTRHVVVQDDGEERPARRRLRRVGALVTSLF